jgi:hypothetical protein
VCQLFTGPATGSLSGIELGLIGSTIEARQHIALLEGLTFTQRQIDNTPGQLTGKHGLILRSQHPSGFTERSGLSTCGSSVIQQRINFGRSLRLSDTRRAE